MFLEKVCTTNGISSSKYNSAEYWMCRGRSSVQKSKGGQSCNILAPSIEKKLSQNFQKHYFQQLSVKDKCIDIIPMMNSFIISLLKKST